MGAGAEVAAAAVNVAASADVQLVEVGPRDGLQSEAACLAPAARAELIGRLARTGLRRIEAVAFVSPRRVPQMAGAETVLAAVSPLRSQGVRLSGLALNRRGVERAIDAGVDEVNFVVVSTDTFSRKNQGRSTRQSLAEWLASAQLARQAGMSTTVTVAAAFGCPYEGRVSLDRVVGLAGSVLEGQPTELAIADTIGAAVPTAVGELVSRVAELGSEATLRCHFHNTRNAGYANVVAAIAAGVRVIDTSIGGIGGCPFAPRATGNVCTEDVAWMLSEMGISVGVDLDLAIDTSRWIGGQLGIEPDGLLGRAGPFPTPGTGPG
ncbi:MAG: hydroxymethylglutaryl-CoA lyase [Acidimicrobiales bacterium]